MSQSDYIRYKRISNELKYDTLPPVLNNKQYVDYKQYTILNTTVSLKPDYREPTPFGTVNIFDMNKKVLFCPDFVTCKNTNSRPNRVPMSNVYFTPKYLTKYVKDPANAKKACDCKLNTRKNGEFGVCKCKMEQ
jgi:hypothetical protein